MRKSANALLGRRAAIARAFIGIGPLRKRAVERGRARAAAVSTSTTPVISPRGSLGEKGSKTTGG
jgi:hypothetical protein